MHGPNTRRRISDWIGFLCFTLLALVALSKVPAVGVLPLVTVACEFLTATAFLIREPARRVLRSSRARLAAYAGSFLLLAFIQIASASYPQWLAPSRIGALRVIGLLLWLAGSMLAGWSVWHLRYAFSIEPEARRLVTSGPYRIARHPVYAAYFIQYMGMWLIFPTVPFACVLLAWVALMLDRMRHEERVLNMAFPEYSEYRSRVGALGPAFMRRSVRARQVAADTLGP